MRRTHLLALLALWLVSACAWAPVNPPAPVPPVPPIPGPVDPPAPPPPPVVDELPLAKWEAVAVGMTEAEVVAITGKPAKRVLVGPGYVALGFYVTWPTTAERPGQHYVEATLGADGKVASLVVW